MSYLQLLPGRVPSLCIALSGLPYALASMPCPWPL